MYEYVTRYIQKKKCERFARQTGFIKRKRKIGALDFLLMMTTVISGMIHPSLAAMVDAVSLKVRREALHMRLSQSAVAFMSACNDFVLHQKVTAMTAIFPGVLSHFKRILLIDSTAWHLPPALEKIFPGSKSVKSSACCKVQMCYEYRQGAISFFDITGGNVPDSKYTSCLPDFLRAHDLVIFDLGYFCMKTFSRIDQLGAYFISRFLIGTTLCDQMNNPINLFNILKKTKEDVLEFSVIMGSREQTKISCRLICLRVNEEIAQQRRRKLKERGRRLGRTYSPKYLFFASWILMITNVPQTILPAKMVRPFYSLRWQIELLFKQMKSVLAIDVVNTRNEHRLCCELLGKLIMVIIIHRIHSYLNIRLWNSKQQEISFDKVYKRVQERSLMITNLLIKSIDEALLFLLSNVESFSINCRKLKQKTRLLTLEMLVSTQLNNIERAS